jgi:hypothetical protein
MPFLRNNFGWKTLGGYFLQRKVSEHYEQKNTDLVRYQMYRIKKLNCYHEAENAVTRLYVRSGATFFVLSQTVFFLLLECFIADRVVFLRLNCFIEPVLCTYVHTYYQNASKYFKFLKKYFWADALISLFNAQTMHIKPIVNNSIAMLSLKTLHLVRDSNPGLLEEAMSTVPRTLGILLQTVLKY